MNTNRFFAILAIVAGLLLIPLIAMQFSTEVNWTLFDFVIMGTLLSCVSFGLDFAWRSNKKLKTKLWVMGSILLVFLLIWAELAVGIFGTSFAGS